MKKEKTNDRCGRRADRCDLSNAGVLWKSGEHGILYRLFLTRHYRSIGTPFCSCGTVHPSGDHRAGAWCMHRVTDYKGISSERWFGTGYQIYTGSFCYDRMSDVPWVSVPNDSASGWW